MGKSKLGRVCPCCLKALGRVEATVFDSYGEEAVECD
jgi:hypothetical protein